MACDKLAQKAHLELAIIEAQKKKATTKELRKRYRELDERQERFDKGEPSARLTPEERAELIDIGARLALREN